MGLSKPGAFSTFKRMLVSKQSGRLVLPERGEVHLWSVFFSEFVADIPGFLPLLSEAEKQNSARFVQSADRERYVVAHGILRQLLGCYLSQPPADLAFTRNAFGKPALVQPEELHRLCFNLSHSGEVILFALSQNSRVGVDVEAIRNDLDVLELAEGRFSSPEIKSLYAEKPSEQIDAFFRCWTRKEAYVKARGEGLGFPLDQFTVSCGSVEEPRVQWAADDPLASERWSVLDATLAPGYAGAVVVENRPVQMIHRQWGRSDQPF